MNKLNVCLINDSFPPVIDGVANAVTNYADIIHREYGEATVVTPYYPGADDGAFRFPVVRYPSLDMTKLVGYRAGMPFSSQVFQHLETSGFDIIHSHCPVTSTVLARALRERIRVPVVFTYHTKFDVDIANAIRGKLLRESAARILAENISACDEVWVVSRGAGENLRKLGYGGDYIVMPNGVDFPRGRVDESLIAQVTEGYDLPKDLPVFLFVGRMMWYKGIRIILNALKRLADDGTDFRMVFVGAGGDKEEIAAYTESLGLNGKVQFSPAVRDRNLVRAWYCRANLFLFPSTFDTNGLVVREAAACGLASVLVEGSCAAEDVTDGVSGFLIREDAESMAAKLRQILDNPEVMRRVGEGAQREIYVSWEEAVSRAYRRYFTVINNFRRGVYPDRDKFTDEFFRGVANLLNTANKSRKLQQQMVQQFRDQMNTDAMNSYNTFMERMDRFL